MKRGVKIFSIILVSLIALLIAGYSFISYKTLQMRPRQDFGLTFSSQHAEWLGLDVRETYQRMLKDFPGVKLRLPSYWEELEPVRGQYEFTELAWQLNQALNNRSTVTLSLGMRQPRWPECHIPQWALDLPETEREQAQKEFIAKVVETFKNHKAIEVWQVENEFFLGVFGVCPEYRESLLAEEIELVKSLDTRPVLVTGSGELSTWRKEVGLGDYFGSTLYRITWNKYLKYQGYWYIPASLYRVRAYLHGLDFKKYWIAEMQAEPWLPENNLEISLEEQYHTMNPTQLEKNINFAFRTNASRIYLWGVEWWYYVEKKFANNEVLEAAKNIINEKGAY